MGPTWPFLHMLESRVERHSFCGIEALNGYMYSASLRVVNGPLGRGVTILLFAKLETILLHETTSLLFPIPSKIDLTVSTSSHFAEK